MLASRFVHDGLISASEESERCFEKAFGAVAPDFLSWSGGLLVSAYNTCHGDVDAAHLVPHDRGSMEEDSCVVGPANKVSH